MKYIKRFLNWMFNGPDEGSWTGHWLQAFALFMLGNLIDFGFGFGLALGAFAHREASDMLAYVMAWGWKKAIRRKMLDGIMDLLSPIMAILTGILFLLSLQAGLAGVLASGVVIAGVAMSQKDIGR